MTLPTPHSFDWAKIIQLRAMPRLKEFGDNLPHLFDDFYQIGPTEYVRASRQWRDASYTEEDVFVYSFIWAPTPMAFRLLTKRNADDLAAMGDNSCPLPDALRPTPDCLSYGAIRDFVSKSGLRSNEIDLFDHDRRWKLDGSGWLSIGSCLFVPRFTYYFRSPLPVPGDELPYGASYDTRSDETIKRLWHPRKDAA